MSDLKEIPKHTFGGAQLMTPEEKAMVKEAMAAFKKPVFETRKLKEEEMPPEGFQGW